MSNKLPVALQLYTVRDYTEKDFIGTVKKVADIGYDGVELAGMGNLTAKELRNLLDDLGLKAVSSHVALELMEKDLNKEIDDALTLGLKYVAVPYLADSRRKSREDYINIANTLQDLGEKWGKEGVQLCYHNHNFEFEKFDGSYGFDILYGNTEPSKLQVELDTFWVTYSGLDPIAYLHKYAGRVPLVHLKDMIKDELREGVIPFAEVGEGRMDMAGIMNTAAQIGSKWLIVEQDMCARPSIESAKISFENIKKING